MLFRISFFLLALAILTDWYIYVRFICRVTKRNSLRLLYWAPTILLMLAQLGLVFCEKFNNSQVQLTGIYIIIYMAIVVPKTLFCLFALVGQLGGFIWRPIRMVGASLGIIVGLWSLWIVFYGTLGGWKHYKVKQITYYSEDIPETFDGYRIVQFSDLHIGTIAKHRHQVERLIDSINAQQGDIIVFTGDLVNNRATELNGVEDILSRLHAPDGVYSVLGNHDFSPYLRWQTPEAQANNLQDLIARETRMGWHMLNNDHALIHRGDTCIALIGVENEGFRPHLQRGDLPRAMQGTEGLFRILLSHDPTHWRQEVLPDTDIPLMLSGHTHAMQFSIFGHTPASWFFTESAGMYEEDGQSLYVNPGIGEVMIPFRYGAWPEITVITLRAK